MNMMKKNGGFTLVELIVVIAILAILAGIAVPAYSGYINSANEAADVTALSAVKTAAMATFATQGTVTKLVVTESSVVATVDGVDGDQTLTSNADFLSYYGTSATAFSMDLKTGTTATWDNTADAAADVKGEWQITTSDGN